MLVSPWVPLSSGTGSIRCSRLARLPGFVQRALGAVISGGVPQYIGYDQADMYSDMMTHPAYAVQAEINMSLF